MLIKGDVCLCDGSLTCCCHVFAGPDWLKAHKGDLHRQNQAHDVEGAVGCRGGNKAKLTSDTGRTRSFFIPILQHKTSQPLSVTEVGVCVCVCVCSDLAVGK